MTSLKTFDHSSQHTNAESRERPNVRSPPFGETRESRTTNVNCDLVPKNMQTK